ncbi:MAG: hypothetical protein RIE58_10195 [Vicingaceae bacterium]
MNGLRRYFSYLVIAALGLFLVSCAEEGSGESAAEEPTVEEEVVIEDQVHYQVPSPSETMEFLRSTNAEFHPEVLCSVDIREKYVDLKGKSMGMGIFIADLAYASSFEKYQEAIKYFTAIIKMADDIGIGSSFDQALLSRIENNLSSPDSLTTISDDSYYKIIADLESNDRGKIVGMIAAGGFLEGLFIAVQLVDKFDANDPAIKRIAAQKLTYENIIKYLEQYREDQNVEWTLMDMKALEQIFLEVSDNRMDTEFSSNKSGKRVLGGTGGVYITEQEFEELRDQVTYLRNTITFNPPVPQ